MSKKTKSIETNSPEDSFIEEMTNAVEDNSSAPVDDGDSQLANTQEEEVPSDIPPSEDDQENFNDSDEGVKAAVWHTNKKITSLWSKNETRNSWAYVTGLGWKKINPSIDSSCVSMTIMAAHARNYDKYVKLLIDNNQIKEIYVW